MDTLAAQALQALSDESLILPQAPLDQTEGTAEGPLPFGEGGLEAACRAIAGLADIAGERGEGTDGGKHREEIQRVIGRGGGKRGQALHLRAHGGGEGGILGAFERGEQWIEHRLDDAVDRAEHGTNGGQGGGGAVGGGDVGGAILRLGPQGTQFIEEGAPVGVQRLAPNQEQPGAVAGGEVAGDVAADSAHPADQQIDSAVTQRGARGGIGDRFQDPIEPDPTTEGNDLARG